MQITIPTLSLSSRYRLLKQAIRLLCWLISFSLTAAPVPKTYQAVSPDGKTRFEVGIVDQKLAYRVLFNKQVIVTWSELGFQLNDSSVGQAATITKATRRRHNERFPWPLGENDQITNQYNELSIGCRSGSVDFQLITRVFNGSVAFRYSLPETTEASLIRKENTRFALTGEYTLYQYNEETVFTPTLLSEMSKTCDFPATLTNGKLFISIGEADNQSFTKAVLTKGTASHSLDVSFRKDSVKTTGAFLSPWRTISVSQSAIGLHAFSDLPLRLCPPTIQGIPAWVKPGKLIRSALTTQGGLNCIDFAIGHNFQYIMFDAGWYGAEFRSTSDPTQVIPAIDMPRVIAYGKEKGIGVILYVNRVALRAKLDTILPLYKQWGVAGLKFGFVDGLSQEGISWLIPAIKKVYDHGFVLNIHDNYKPTGLSRMYPNLLTQEGIRGNENNPDAFHNTVLPFTRFLAGAADYTFCYPNTNQAFTDNLLKTKLQVTK